MENEVGGGLCFLFRFSRRVEYIRGPLIASKLRRPVCAHLHRSLVSQRADFRSRRCALTACLQLPLFAAKEQIIADPTFPVYRWIRWLLPATNGYKGNQRAEDPAPRTIDCIPGARGGPFLPGYFTVRYWKSAFSRRGPVLLRPKQSAGLIRLLQTRKITVKPGCLFFSETREIFEREIRRKNYWSMGRMGLKGEVEISG